MKFLKHTSVLLLALMLLVLLAACAPVGGSSLVISEVMSSNSDSLTHEALGSPDWVEILNPTEAEVDLSGWMLRNNEKVPDIFTFPEGTSIPAGGYLLVYCVDDGGKSGELCTGFKLPKTGSALVLMDTGYHKVEELALPESEKDVSWALTESGYQFCVTPTPGAANEGTMLASLAELEDLHIPEGLVLSEVTRDWAEIHNTASAPADLSSVWLTDDVASPMKWRFPAVTLPAGEYLVVSLTGEPLEEEGLVANFGLNSEEFSLSLACFRNIGDTLTFADLTDGFSYGRNDKGEATYFAKMTPGEANSPVSFTSMDPVPMEATAPLHLSEVLLENKTSLMDEEGDRDPWVELVNTSDKEVELDYYRLSDDPLDPAKWAFPEGETLAPGAYKVVHLSGKGGAQTDFRVARGESVVLTDLATMSVEEVKIPDESRLSDISYGVQDGKWLYFGAPTPGKANNTHGVEEISNAEKLVVGNVWIAEVSAAAPAKSGKQDWIELYNSGTKDVNLAGWHLSNDLDEPGLFPLQGSIPAGGYKIIYTSSSPSEQTEEVAPFGISNGGEELVLTDEQGGTVDYFRTGALRLGVTSGRETGKTTGDRVFFDQPTPGEANAAPALGYSVKPEFSHEGGFYTQPVTLTIEGAGTIYYTTDGTKPDKGSKVYTEPIKISDTTVVKAVCHEQGKLLGDMTVASFLYAAPHTVPVLSITMDPSDFSAVYAVSSKDRNVERECFIEYYEPDGTLGTTFAAGIRVAGASTRTAAQKSFNVYCRSAYGQTSVTYPFFKDYPFTTFKSLNLRNSGQDRGEARLADAFSSMLGKGMDLDYAESRFVVAYINGRYWGIYDLKENQNEDFFAYRHGLDPDNINVIRRNQTALAGTKDEILRVRAYARTKNMADNEVLKEFCQWVDEGEIMDYVIAQTYICNSDMFNQKYWRENDYKVGWRLIYYDLDFGFRNAPTRNILGSYFNPVGVPSANGSLTNMDVQVGLKKNALWRQAFIQRYAYHLNNTFTRSEELFESMVKELEPEMQRHINRWGAPSSMSSWKSYVSKMRKFVTSRTGIVKGHLKSYFSLSDAEMKELFPEG